MKKVLPPAVRLVLRLLWRSVQDWRSGEGRRLVRASARRSIPSEFTPQVAIAQALKSASYAENKRHNLLQASERINGVRIEPGEIFSFWTLVGKPSAQNGYLPGRSLVRGTLQAEYGGGLCQLSGLIYYLALQAGLKVVERYPHSVDIYTDETRFTPLGSDATVVYGYKDLRVVNNLSQPICFNVQVKADEVVGKLWAAQLVARYTVDFEMIRRSSGIEVVTFRRLPTGTEKTVLDVSHYRLLENTGMNAIVS